MANKRFTTAPGAGVYPRLKTPDTKFDELGIYKADVAIPLAEAEELMAELSAIYKAHTGKAAKKTENTMWYLETDDAGEETGNVVFKIRVKNRMTKKGELWDRRPKLFDASLKPIDVNPYGGSIYSVFFEVYEWDAGGKKGVSLQPIGVQVIELRSGDGPSGAAMGFQAQEGYSAPEDDAASGFKGDPDEDADGSDDDIPDGADY